MTNETLKQALEKCERLAIESGAHESYKAVRDAFEELRVSIAAITATQQAAPVRRADCRTCKHQCIGDTDSTNVDHFVDHCESPIKCVMGSAFEYVNDEQPLWGDENTPSEASAQREQPAASKPEPRALPAWGLWPNEVIAKKDAALKACVDALEFACKNGDEWIKDHISAAITQGQEARK